MNEEVKTVVNKAMNPAMDIVEATASKPGKSAAVVVGFTAGAIILGGIIVGGVKLGAKAIAKHKEKKAMRKPTNVVEPTQEQLNEVTE